MQLNAFYRKAIEQYRATLEELRGKGGVSEQHLRPAFQHLLTTVCKKVDWTLVPEQRLPNGKVPDGTLRDPFLLPRGYWEAKDTADDLDTEITKKSGIGYPLLNTIFEDTRHAVLFQDGRRVLDVALDEPRQVADLLQAFTTHAEPNIEQFEQAVDEFKARIPELARGVLDIIATERRANSKFIAAFSTFHDLCRTALDPRITAEQIDEMLVQHLLTERLFRTVFDNPDFTRRNAIAGEIERVIAALTSRSFNRDGFLKTLDRFYVAIEDTARGLQDFTEKQHFLNVVYERFFQGFSVKQADTMGIVYTPQEIVDFMCASVDEVLRREFGKSLSTPGVKILDPCVGTGNFIVNILRRINGRDLPKKYAEDLFCNEIMLLPYYIASLNIEHEYYGRTGEYAPFEGICFTDTLDLAESKQLGLFSEENTARVAREKGAEITVIIGNPPYNVGQKNENDNNKNRKYPVMEKRVTETYSKDSTAQNNNALDDVMYKFYRWATDRLGNRDGLICFVSNNAFIDALSLDGMRKHFEDDFTAIYHFNFKGNARTSGERRRKEGGNIFRDLVRVGVGITLLIKNSKGINTGIYYHEVPDYWREEQKSEYLRSFSSIASVPWHKLYPDQNHTWLTEGLQKDFNNYIVLSTKNNCSNRIFDEYSMGVVTNRDNWIYDFQFSGLAKKSEQLINCYNSEINRWETSGRPTDIDSFVINDDKSIKWCSRMKECLKRALIAHHTDASIRNALYRPFTKKYLYFDPILTHRRGNFHIVFPSCEAELNNIAICLTDIASEKPFMVLMTNFIADLHLVGAAAGSQCFPFYIYNEDGSNRRENITDWALGEFRAAYGDGVSKWDIFHYVYALLHHPAYRARYAENLKRELPRIPLTVAPGDFAAYVETGRRLADLHLHYETVDEYPLE